MKLALALACLLFASPAIAEDVKPQPVPQLTQQDVQDIASALSVVGSLCNSDRVPQCQAGADSRAVFAKVQAIYDAQQAASKLKK